MKIELRNTSLHRDVPIYSVFIESDESFITLDIQDIAPLFPDISLLSLLRWKYRCVDFERLETIMKHGVDVIPTDSPIYVNTLKKAMEYGEWPKVCMAFDSGHLKHTFLYLNAGIDAEELLKLRAEYPTMSVDSYQQTIMLSRLKENDRRRGTPYEAENARWIPGSPWDALKMIVILHNES